MSNSGNQNNPPSPIDDEQRQADDRAEQDSDQGGAASINAPKDPKIINK